MQGALGKGRKQVLLAEDDLGTRTALTRTLEELGVDVVAVPDGGRLLVAITGQYRAGFTPNDIDLIITDLSMPVIDGLEICRGLRAARCTTPIIIITARDDSELNDWGAQHGATILHKPLDLTAFERAVADSLSTRFRTLRPGS